MSMDEITPANFSEDRLRGLGVARGRILAFSIDLPCECVISTSPSTAGECDLALPLSL